MKCPICQGELQDVSARAQRMKCPACKHVFDKGQLREFYGLDEISEANGPHDYETEHMHAMEKGHANRPDAKPKKMTSANAPVKNESPIAPGSFVQSVAEQAKELGLQFQEEQQERKHQANTYRPQGQGPNQASRPDGSFMISSGQPQMPPRPTPSNNSTKTIVWVLIIVFFIIPFFSQFVIGCAAVMLSAIGEFDTSSNNNAPIVHNYNSTSNANANRNANANAPISKANLTLEDYKLEISQVRLDKTYQGDDILIVTYRWFNSRNAETYFNALGYGNAHQGMNSLAEVSYISLQSSFDADSRFADVEPGQTGTVDVAYALENRKDGVTVSFKLFGVDSQSHQLVVEFDEQGNPKISMSQILS